MIGDGKRPLPDRLSITFFSYTEDQFYEGDFDLPYKKISKLFRDGFYSANEGNHTTYHKIIVGVAPGGFVSVWLWGFERIVEVFMGQANKIEGDWKWIISNSDYTREQYIKEDIEESVPDVKIRESIYKNGPPIGLWKKYTKRYQWKPEFLGMPLRSKRINIIKYFNGEQDYLHTPVVGDIAKQTRAIPSYLTFVWEPKNGKARLFDLMFDEKEIFEAFDKLSKNNGELILEMKMAPDPNKKQVIFTVKLVNDSESLFLKKTEVETYPARDREA